MLSSQTLCPSSWSFCVAFMASPPHSFESRCHREQATQFTVEQVCDPIHRHVGREAGERLRVMRVLSLSRKDGGDAGAPSLLDRREDSRLVIYQDVVERRIARLDIVKGELLVDVDQYM